MSTITLQPASVPDAGTGRTAPLQRFFGVVAQPNSYRNVAFLLLGLPLGTIWFSVLVAGVSVAVSVIVVALIGIPMLFGLWYVTRAFANVERGVANALPHQRLSLARMNAPQRGNVWVRLRSMTRDRDRWRELGYLMLRFRAGVATFTAAVTALVTPFLVAYAPIVARHDEEPFGDWALSSRMVDVASSPRAWLLVPLGVMLLIVSFHLLNALARVCARWAAASLSGA